MKKLIFFLGAAAAVYFIYYNFYKKDIIEVTENIIVSQASGMDINAGPSPPPKYAHIEGNITNTGEKNLNDIIVKYRIGYDTLSVKIDFLAPGQNLKFITNKKRTRNNNPEYNLESVSYNEE